MDIIFGDIEFHISTLAVCLWAVVAIVAIVCREMRETGL